MKEIEIDGQRYKLVPVNEKKQVSKDQDENKINEVKQKEKTKAIYCKACGKKSEDPSNELRWFEPEGYGDPYCRDTCYNRQVEEYNDFQKRFWDDIDERMKQSQ